MSIKNTEVSGIEKLAIVVKMMEAMGLAEDANNISLEKGVSISMAVQKAIIDTLADKS